MSHAMWDNDDPKARFWRRLIRERAIDFMRSKDFLRSLRCNYEESRKLQKRFGKVWAEYGTDIFELVAEACGENWDLEDEQKSASARDVEKKGPAVNKIGDDDLVATRESRSCERLDQLQGVPEKSECVLEKDKGQIDWSEEEEEGWEETEKGGRSADFYRRAGGDS